MNDLFADIREVTKKSILKNTDEKAHYSNRVQWTCGPILLRYEQQSEY